MTDRTRYRTRRDPAAARTVRAALVVAAVGMAAACGAPAAASKPGAEAAPPVPGLTARPAPVGWHRAVLPGGRPVRAWPGSSRDGDLPR